jgi:hypothetical protein
MVDRILEAQELEEGPEGNYYEAILTIVASKTRNLAWNTYCLCLNGEALP